MKKLLGISIMTVLTAAVYGQEEVKDTTRVNLGKVEVLIVGADGNSSDTIKINPKEHRHNEAHWAGVDFGFTVLMNDAGGSTFPADPYLKNDIARSHVWNFNILEHKFKIVKEYVGLTTGLGFSLNQVSFDNNFILGTSGDSTFAIQDTIIGYDKNKIRATYLSVPLLLEFNTNKNNEKGFYLAAGVVGGLRIASRYKTVHKMDGEKVKAVQKGDYNLNPFKLDATVRLGYGTFGAFASYNLLPLFENGAMASTAYPLTAGLTLNF